MTKLLQVATRWVETPLRLLFVTCVAYPVVWLWLGIHVRHRERLPSRGPAIIAANHNSHLDILTLLSLFPLLRIPGVQPAAAADYFCKNWLVKWFSLHVIGIIPVVRGQGYDPNAPDPLADCYRALEAGKVLVIFPEGTRGTPEEMAELKAGIWHLAKRYALALAITMLGPSVRLSHWSKNTPSCWPEACSKDARRSIHDASLN